MIDFKPKHQTKRFTTVKNFFVGPVTTHLFCTQRLMGSHKALPKIQNEWVFTIDLEPLCSSGVQIQPTFCIVQVFPAKSSDLRSAKVNDGGCWICRDAAGPLTVLAPECPWSHQAWECLKHRHNNHNGIDNTVEATTATRLTQLN